MGAPPLSQMEVNDEPFTAAEFEQIEKLAPYWDATNPDLRPFEQAGGKLILWQGEADWSIPTITSIAYYQAVIKAMGGLFNTQQFAKYYLLPSVGHCGGNGPDTYDGLGAVVAWTEKHISPNALVATQYAPATAARRRRSGWPWRPTGQRSDRRRPDPRRSRHHSSGADDSRCSRIRNCRPTTATETSTTRPAT